MDRPPSVSTRGSGRKRLARRAGAALVDLSLAAFTALVVLFVWVVLIALSTWAGIPADPGIEEWNYLAVVGLVLYYVPLKYFWGTTPGKHAFGLAIGDGRPVADGNEDVDRSGVAHTTRRRPLDGRPTGTVVGTVRRIEVQVENVALGALGRLASVDGLDRTDHEWRAHPGIGVESRRASHRNRALAAAIDLFAALVAWAIGVSGMAVIAGTLEAAPDAISSIPLAGNPIWLGSLGAVMIVWPIGYFVVCEYRYGTTIGKWQYGLVVTDAAGELASLRAIVLRNLFRPVDVLGGALLALVTDRRRRLGDLAAGTVVSTVDLRNR